MLQKQSSRSVSEDIIRTVAAREGTDPVALETPLFDAIDPDALDALFARASDGAPSAVTSLGFEFAGYRIQVDGDGTVSVEN